MSISFSGLASGLDTTSWVESLVQLRQAKVDTLEEQKKAIALCRETLSNIKSFFSSFRSMIEKVTDAKFGVASMDIFAQKLATSSNTSVLTALANTEAEESTYNINVSQLASNTQAITGYKYTTTAIHTATATMDTRLTDLGVKTGEVGINVDGFSSRVAIGDNDTISSFIGKLKNIGVDANYNENSGIFSVNLNRNNIDDTISNTGIADILHLTKTGGYESSFLEITNVETIVSAATGATKLSELGTINAGNIQVKANDNTYTFSINENTTLDDLINNLRSKGIEAELTSDGVFTIKDAEIVDSGSTGIIDALGLEQDVNSKTHTASNLSFQSVTTTVTSATNSTKLKDLEVWAEAGSNPTLTVNGASVSVNGDMTLEQLMTALRDKGVNISLNNGKLVVSGSELGGSVADALGISPGANTGNISQSGVNYVKTTVSVFATGETKLSELGITSSDKLEIHDSAGNAVGTITVSDTSTTDINALFSSLASNGITASINDGRITLTSSDGSYVSGTMADKLGIEVQTIGSTTTTGISITSSNPLTYSSTVTATGTSKISDFVSLPSNAVIYFKGSDGSSKGSYTVTTSTTFNDLISKCGSMGVTATLNDGVLSFSSSSGVYLSETDSNGVLAQLGITTQTISDTRTTTPINVTSSAPITYTVGADLTLSTKVGDVLSGSSWTLNTSNGYSMTIGSSNTFSEIQNWLSSYSDISMSINSNGTISLSSASGQYVTGTFADAVGWGTTTSTTTQGISMTGSVVSVNTSVTATGTSKISDFVSLPSNAVIYFNGSDGSLKGSYTVTTSTTFNNLISKCGSMGVTATLNDGVLSFSSSSGVYLSETGSNGVLAQLGISTQMISDTRTTTPITVTSSAPITYTVGADLTLSTKVGDVLSGSSWTLNASNGYSMTIGSSNTFSEIQNWLSSYADISMSINSNGTISLSSASGNYVTGTFADAVGWGTTTSTTTQGISMTGDTVYYTTTVTRTATMSDTMKDITGSGGYITITNSDGTSYSKNMGISDTIESLNTWLIDKTSGAMSLSMSDGVISVSGKEYRFSGDLATSLGLDNYTTSYKTVGMSQTGLQVTYTVTETATMTSKISDCISNWDSISHEVYISSSAGNILETVTISDTDTFDLFNGYKFSSMGYSNYSFSASMTNGSLTIENTPGNESSSSNTYLYGDIITALGISYTTTGEKVTQTVGTTSTGGVITTSDNGQAASESTLMTAMGYYAGDILETTFLKREVKYVHSITITATTTLKDVANQLNTFAVHNSIGKVELKQQDDGLHFKITFPSPSRKGNGYIAAFLLHYDSEGKMSGVSGRRIYSTTWSGWAPSDGRTTREIDKVVNTSSDKVLQVSVSKTMNGSTLLGDIFGADNLTILCNSQGIAINLGESANHSVNDFLNVLVGRKFATSATIDSNGRIKLVADSTCRPLTGISLNVGGENIGSVSNFLGLEIGEGKSYKQKELYNTSPSNQLTVNEAVRTTITSDTTLAELGLTGSYYNFTISVDGVESTHKWDTPSGTTVGDFITWLNSKSGISASLNNGQITIEGSGNSYLKSTESTFASKLGLSHGSGYTYSTNTVTTNTDSNVLGATSVETLNTGTKLVDLGFSTGSKNLIDTTAGAQYFTINSNSTMQDLINWFSTKGFSASILSGKLSLNPSGSNYITWMSNDFKNKFALDCGEGITYNATGEVIIGNTNSNKQQTSGSDTITSDTTLSELGLTDSYYNFTISVDGVESTYQWNTPSGTTVGDFITWLNSKSGISASLNNGQITIEGSGNSYLKRVASTFASKLGLSYGSGYTYSTNTVTTNTDSNVLGASSVETLTTGTKLVDLGFSTGSQNLIDTTAGVQYFTINSNSTMQDLINWFSTKGFSASILNGKLSLNPSGSNYITWMSNDFKNKFALNYGEGKTYNSTGELKLGNSNSNKFEKVATTTASANTTLGELGLSGNATIVTQATNGGKNTIVVNSTTKLSDLSGYLNVNGGKLTLSPSSNEFIYSMSSNLADILKLAGSGEGLTYKTEGSTSYKNINTKALSTTQTVAANSTTKLNELINAPTNPALIIQTEAKNGMVKNTTINFGKTESLSSVFSALAANGINAYIDGNGKVHLNSDSLADFNLSGSLADYLLGSGSTKTFGITNDLTSKTITTSTAAATRDTLLSDLGVTSGEYYIYKDGVKYTALISSDETLGSFIETLQSFGLQAGFIQNGNSSKLVLIGSGDSYISKSLNPTTASNVVEKLFTSSSPTTSYDYSGSELLYATITTKQTATEDTLLSTFDTPWGGSTLKSAGNLALTVNGENKIIKIEENETFGSLVDKLKDTGVQAAFLNGQLYISDANGVSINAAATTSAIINPNAGIKLAFKDTIDGFLASSDSVTQTTTLIEEHTVSASNYADMNTKLSTLNISSGTLSVYRNGQKALINDVDENWSFSDLQSAISHKFSDVKLNIEDGYLKFYSDTAGVSVEVGSTTDSSNFLAITGMHKDEDGSSISSRELYKVNTDSKVTEAGLFRRGTVKEGDFTIGTAKFTIDENTTLGDIISQINNSDEANATAWWDSIGGKLVIKSRTTGAALINIEAGKSDFTDIMGYTTSEWNADGSVKFTQLNADTQELGKNAKFTINGTAYTTASNTVTSDVTRIKGVTLDLKSISGDTVTLKIEKDKETVAKSLEEVVNAYNELMQNVDEAIASQGKLHDQTTLKMIRNQLKMYMTSSDAGADVFRNLYSIGISVSSASAGNISTSNQNIINLAFDKDKFLEAYEKDDKAVKALLIGSDNNKGVFTKVEELLENALQGVTGYFDSAEASYDKKVGNLQIKINKQTASLQKYRAFLEKKFSAMDMMIANMQQQYSSYLGSSNSNLFGMIK